MEAVFVADFLSLASQEEDVRAGELVLDAKVCDEQEVRPVVLKQCVRLLVVIEDGLMSKNEGVVGVEDRKPFNSTSLAGLK